MLICCDGSVRVQSLTAGTCDEYPKPGSVAEWFKALVLKTSVGQLTVSSNLTTSAKNKNMSEEIEDDDDVKVIDSNGNELSDGDSVIVIKDLPIKGSSKPIKSGTKVKNIRLKDGNNGHNIDCKIEGFGSVSLKSEFVKKA